MIAQKITWSPVRDHPEFSESGDWLFESPYRGLRIACGYNEAGPVAWVGHPTEDYWIDSVACDGSFESGAERAAQLADEAIGKAQAGDANWLESIGVKLSEVEQ